MTTHYRPEIDGLRAVAVIPVILFHAGFETFSGGYVGVDIFFVISGYLITGIIYNEIVEEQFSIVNFYERRARRILPSLFFVSIVCMAVAWVWMLPEEFASLSKSLVAVNLFISNIHYWQDMDYFAGPAEMKPFLHTWSLAVEEQFYLFFPLFMLLVGWVRKWLLIGVLTLCFLFSLALSDYASTHHPSANFYLLPTRAWELLAGAIVAVFLHRHRAKPPLWVSSLGGVVGIVLLLYAILIFDQSVPFPGRWALIPVLGTTLIILFASERDITGKVLSFKPMVGIGLISYSAYLWHQPVFAFARERSLGPISHIDFILLSILSLLLAWFSWHYVELPFRNRNKYTRPQIFSTALVMSCLMIGVGFYGTYSQGIPWRFNGELENLVMVRSQKKINANCQSTPGNLLPFDETCVYNENGNRTVVIWGDSQATPLVGPVAERVDALDMKVRQFVYTNCLPIAGYTRSDEPECGRHNEQVLEYVLEDDSVELVMMLGRYPLQFEGVSFNNGEGGIEHDGAVRAVPMNRLDISDEELRIEQVGSLLKETVERMARAGKRVVLVYPVPEVGWDVPYFLVKERLYGIERFAPLSTSYEVFKQRTASAYEQMARVVEHDNLIKIEPARLFCDTYLPSRCATQIEEVLLYYDNNHLSVAGASILVAQIFEEMKSKGWVSEEELKLSMLNGGSTGNVLQQSDSDYLQRETRR
ncbi:acyltransferase [Billgrantia diversa]|uniref:acyltransferase family protein n=1 Tax=Halomonas sp. MCCC 1A13316 TaxID=2733487 RepID=UPI0018A659B3|nr:acyltransferase family protein [Halomonas sp. MCCC 1A13316]QOR39302.1 acyltransferase [Halomonas sp. MCCC 1A13316]